MSAIRVLGLHAKSYSRHALHADERIWVEKNCYIDIWIELIHALGLDPLPACAFTLAIDFEDDQWTFFKPPHTELWEMYGIDVQELNVWRPLLDHTLTHLGEGKLLSTEADAFFLPDTAGTDYRTHHTKTTIVIESVDAERGRMGYFHNAGYFDLEGTDFEALFRVGAPADPTFMPLYAEIIRIDRIKRLAPADLAERSRETLERHLGRFPARNPFARFAARLPEEIERLQTEGLAAYHAWAFASIRQIGAAFELSGLYLRWLQQQGEPGLEDAAASCAAISETAKAFILKGARAVSTKRAVALGPMLAEMAGAWERAVDVLVARQTSLA